MKELADAAASAAADAVCALTKWQHFSPSWPPS